VKSSIKSAGVDADVVHEESADQVVLAPDTRGMCPVGEQEQARVLDAASFANSSPELIPATPPPMMQTSVSTVVPLGVERA
jgi:hypothetical protein